MSTDPQADAITAARSLVETYYRPYVLPLPDPSGQHKDANVLITPTGLKAEALEPYLAPYRERPLRRKGVARFTEQASFIGHVNRFKDADSAVFVDRNRTEPSFLAVLDYHPAGAASPPRFGEHRSVFKPPLSPEWKAWSGAAGKTMNQSEFAEFIEDRIADIRDPLLLLPGQTAADETDEQRRAREIADELQGSYATPQKLMALSRGITLTRPSATLSRKR